MSATTKPTASYQPPVKETPATLRDIISVNLALNELLAQEAELMDTMQLIKVGSLQERKLKLTNMLERYMRYVRNHPEVMHQVTVEEKTELQQVAAQFQKTMKKNYDTLLVARSVNKAVVKCVMQAVTRRECNPVYNAHGATKQNVRLLPISITLNETV